MRKSRPLHEFRQRIGKDRAFVLSGSCSPDGQQTAFLPFIEVVRGARRPSLNHGLIEMARSFFGVLFEWEWSNSCLLANRIRITAA